MNFEIKKMSLSDLDSIKDTLSNDFDDFWNYNILKEELESDTSYYIMALKENEIIGFAGIKIILDEADIMNIVVKKQYRNNGIGKSLLNALITVCKSLNLNCINLEVNEDNKVAYHLYEKYGFENLGLRKNYYKNKNGIIMKKILKDQ